MSTKRLTDMDLKALDAEALALDVAGAPGRARAMEIATTVRRDYLQAREDVKRLAALLWQARGAIEAAVVFPELRGRIEKTLSEVGQ